MGFLQLAWKNVLGNAFRSLAVFLSAAVVAGMALAATFVVRGAEAGLRSNLERLGADILVLPWGTMTEKIEGVRLMSAAIEGWIPRTYMDKIAALDGVEQVSPQLYLGALEDSPYSPYPQMHLVAFDPSTDFTLQPWLAAGQVTDLSPGQAIAGAHISLPDGGDMLLWHEAPLQITGRLAPTETTIDSTLFISFETADQIIAGLQERGMALRIPAGTVSAVMVRLELGSDPHLIAVDILEHVKGVVPLETPNIFQTERQQMIGVLRTLLGALGGVWVLAVLFIGLVFSIAANARRQEIGVLRALGFPSNLILKNLLAEGGLLALAGGFAGIAITLAAFAAFNGQITALARLPLGFPSPLGTVTLALGGQALALASVTLAAFIPAWRISHEEVALTMQE